MIARGFKSVIWAAAVGGAALGCYMVSLRVATERNELARVERQIVAAKREIRSLQTELGTRGRVAQLEQWNAEVLALSAPSSSQYLDDEFTLARLERPQPTVEARTGEVRMASLEAAPSSEAVHAAKPAAPAVVQASALHDGQAKLVRTAAFVAEPKAEAPTRPAKPKAAAAPADKPKASDKVKAAEAGSAKTLPAKAKAVAGKPDKLVRKLASETVPAARKATGGGGN